jgi:hypothetical protein
LVVLVTACGPGGARPNESGETETGETSTDTGFECPIVDPLPDPSPCLEQRAYFEIGSRWACGGAVGGWILLCDSDSDSGMLTLARLGVDDQLDEITQIEGTGIGDGRITRERDGDRLWVLQQPDTVHELDLNGMLLSSAALGVPNVDSTRALTSFEGDLIRTYTTTDQSLAITLERRSPMGELRWTRAPGEIMFDGQSAENMRSPAVRGGTLTMLSYGLLTDSFRVTLIALDPEDGTLLWDLPLTDDNFGGPYFALGGLDESVVVELPGTSFDPDNPGRFRMFAVDDGGSMMWERSYDIPELPVLADAQLAPLGGDLVVQVHGRTLNGETQAGLMRIPAGSGPSCWIPLDFTLAPTWTSPRTIGGGRIIVGENLDPAKLFVFGDGVGGCVDNP